MNEASDTAAAPGRVHDEVRRAVEGLPEVGSLDQAFALLTVDGEGRVDVCLLSRTELETTSTSVRLVVASTKARRNLGSTARATLIAVSGHAAHYLSLRVSRNLEAEGAAAVELEVERDPRDDLGVELQPMRFRVEERLAVLERWDRTRDLLARLGAGSGA